MWLKPENRGRCIQASEVLRSVELTRKPRRVIIQVQQEIEGIYQSLVWNNDKLTKDEYGTFLYRHSPQVSLLRAQLAERLHTGRDLHL